MAQATETGMAVYYLDLLPDNDVAEDGKEREDCWKCCFAVDHEERHMIDFQPVGKVSYSPTTLVAVCDNYDFVAPVYELLRRRISGEDSR